MSGYTKLFQSILQSSVWQESQAVRLVWITLLAMADQDGVVEASIPGLAKTAGVDRADVERAIAMFMAPDSDSRTKDHEGRRLAEVDGGWRIINHPKYREKATAEEYRAKAAARQKRARERKAAAAPVTLQVTSNVTHSVTSRSVTPSHAESRQAEADPEAESHSERASGSGARPPSKFTIPPDLEDGAPLAAPPAAPPSPPPISPMQWDDFAAVPDRGKPSQEPAAIVTRLYQAAYEAARGVPWMNAGVFPRELDAIGMWCEACGRREGKSTRDVAIVVLRNAFLDDYMIANGFPLKLIARQVGELYKPPPKLRTGPAPAPNSMLLADLRQQIGEANSSGRKDTQQRVEALNALIQAEYDNPTGVADESVQRRGSGNR